MAGGRSRGASFWTAVVSLALAAIASGYISVSAAAAASAPSLVPAFVWSNFGLEGGDGDGDGDGDTRRVSYETLSAKELGGVLRQFRERDGLTNADVVMLFTGTKLRSAGLAWNSETGVDDLMQVLSSAVMSSSSSVALPYVRLPGDGTFSTEELVAEIVGDLEKGESRLGQVVVAGSCKVEGAPRTKKVLTMRGLELHLAARNARRAAGETDLVVVCTGSDGLKSLSEGAMLDQILWGLDSLKSRYVALYSTDLSRGSMTTSSRTKGRQLAARVYGNETYCNEVCQSKAVVLEGLFVGLTLIIILISGLCCMAGISTPNRFEKSKDDQQ